MRSRSREGAWIEIVVAFFATVGDNVAPVRERGLKCCNRIRVVQKNSRSREGAWIEIRHCRE